jgi:solute carrier family 10 (sodium/bile acid cotransporter), member 3/5
MMPLWLFTLGKVLFDRSRLNVPYSNLASYAFGLIIPLAIGIAIQRCSPRLTRILVRILKPMSTLLILFIIIFAIVTNLYLFKLFSLQIVIAGLTLPWLGYLFGFIFAKICGQVPKDALAIAIETGVQNTGIAIFMLSALEQPAADLTTVVPVAVAICTPFPLLLLYVIQKLRGR